MNASVMATLPRCANSVGSYACELGSGTAFCNARFSRMDVSPKVPVSNTSDKMRQGAKCRTKGDVDGLAEEHVQQRRDEGTVQAIGGREPSQYARGKCCEE